MGVHCVADCTILTQGCVEASTVMNRNRQVNLMKQETIGIIFNLDLDSGVERGRGLGGRKKEIGERVFLTGTLPQRPFSLPPPPPTQSLCPQNIAWRWIIWSNQKFQ